MIDEPSHSLLEIYPGQQAPAPADGTARWTPRHMAPHRAAPREPGETLVDRFWRIVRS